MSYSSVGAFGAFGQPPPDQVDWNKPDWNYCLKVLTDYGGPAGSVYIQDGVCPSYTGHTGDKPPRPRPCNGGPSALQQTLKIAGYYKGAIDGKLGAGSNAALSAVANKYGVPYGGDPLAISPQLCRAVMKEAIAASTCAGTTTKVGCVVPPGMAFDVSQTFSWPDEVGAAPPATTTTTLRPTVAAIRPELAKVLAARITPIQSTSPVVTSQAARIAAATMTTGGAVPQSAQPQQDVVAPPPAEPPADGGVPTWAYVAGGAVVLGGIAFFVLKKK